MSFHSEPVILAVPPADLVHIASVRETYGSLLPVKPGVENSPEVVTLLGHPDRAGEPELRAGLLGVTVAGLPLTDGRLVFCGYVTTAFLAALETDPLLANCELLDEAELQVLRPQPTSHD